MAVVLRLRQGKTDEAIDLAEASLAAHPDYTQLRNDLAEILAGAGRSPDE
jgi:hypothetical protein